MSILQRTMDHLHRGMDNRTKNILPTMLKVCSLWQLLSLMYLKIHQNTKMKKNDLIVVTQDTKIRTVALPVVITMVAPFGTVMLPKQKLLSC